jgi:hypothetical protein
MGTRSLLFALFPILNSKAGENIVKCKKKIYVSVEAFYININICHRMLKEYLR